MFLHCCIVNETTIGLGFAPFCPVRCTTSILISAPGFVLEKRTVSGIFRIDDRKFSVSL